MTVLINIIFLSLGIGFTFFPVRILYFIYKLFERMSWLYYGEDGLKVLGRRYSSLGENPNLFAENHPFQMIIGRVIGVVLLIIEILAIHDFWW